MGIDGANEKHRAATGKNHLRRTGLNRFGGIYDAGGFDRGVLPEGFLNLFMVSKGR